jgi:PAS domain S-box-containing protein
MNDLTSDNQKVLKLMTESLGVGVWSWEVENDLLTWDEGMLRLYGVDHFRGHYSDWQSMILNEDLKRVQQDFDKALSTSSRFTTWFRVTRPDANIIRIRCDAQVERDSSGKQIRVLGINRDITLEHQNLQDLIEQKTLLTSIVDTLPVAIFMKDLQDDFNFTIWNKAAEGLWGLKSFEVLKKNDYNFFPKEESDLFRAKDLQVIESGVPEVINEEMITLPNNEVRYLKTQKVPVHGRFLLGVSEDITIQKESQLKLIESSKMTSLGEMAGNIAHEINSPLTIIHGRVDLIKRRINSGDTDVTKMLEDLDKIKNTGDRIAKIVRGLGYFSRNSEADPMENIGIKQVIEDTLELCQERFKADEVILDSSEIKNYEIQCRPTQISQVIMNLLSNALDAAKVTNEKWVKITTERSGTFLKISVSDSGHGIPQEILKKIMDPFFTTKEIGKGTGLGLSISQGIVQVHKGELYYDRASKNTTFVILLPITSSELL